MTFAAKLAVSSMESAILHFARGLVSAILLGVCSLANSALAEAPLETKAWLDARSENFRIYSVLDEERTIELLRHLEIMRAVLRQTGVGRPDSKTWWSSRVNLAGCREQLPR